MRVHINLNRNLSWGNFFFETRSQRALFPFCPRPFDSMEPPPQTEISASGTWKCFAADGRDLYNTPIRENPPDMIPRHSTRSSGGSRERRRKKAKLAGNYDEEGPEILNHEVPAVPGPLAAEEL